MYILALSESSWSISLKIIFLFHRRMHRPLYSMRTVLDGHLFNLPASTNNNISHSARSPRGWRWQTNVWANCRFHIHLLCGFPVGTADNYDHDTLKKNPTSFYLFGGSLPDWFKEDIAFLNWDEVSDLMYNWVAQTPDFKNALRVVKMVLNTQCYLYLWPTMAGFSI